jgi:hypothetical protein
MAKQFEDWYKVIKDNIPTSDILYLRELEKSLVQMKELPGRYPDQKKINELLALIRSEELKKVIENIALIYDISVLKKMDKELEQRIDNIGTRLEGLYNIDLILRLKDEIDKNISQLQKASAKSASAVRNLPSVPTVRYQNVTVADALRNTKPQDPFDPSSNIPMARFGGRKKKKTVRNSPRKQKSARKNTRKPKKSARKSARKTKKSVRKSARKTKKSARKSSRKTKKSIRKSVKKSTRKPKSVRKSVKKLIRRV